MLQGIIEARLPIETYDMKSPWATNSETWGREGLRGGRTKPLQCPCAEGVIRGGEQGPVKPAMSIFSASRPLHGQRIEWHEPVVGKRVIVDQELALADEKCPGRGDVEVVKGLDRTGVDALDSDDTAQVAQRIARLELAGLGPAEVGAPEPVVDAANHRVAAGEREPQCAGRRVAVHEKDRLVAQSTRGGVLAQHPITHLDRFDWLESALGFDRRAGGETRPDQWWQILRCNNLGERRLGRCLKAEAELVEPPGVPGPFVVAKSRRCAERSTRGPG